MLTKNNSNSFYGILLLNGLKKKRYAYLRRYGASNLSNSFKPEFPAS